MRIFLSNGISGNRAKIQEEIIVKCENRERMLQHRGCFTMAFAIALILPTTDTIRHASERARKSIIC